MRVATFVALPLLGVIFARAASSENQRAALRGPIAGERQAVAALFSHELTEERMLSMEKRQVSKVAEENMQLASNLARCKRSQARLQELAHFAHSSALSRRSTQRKFLQNERVCQTRSRKLKRSLGRCSAQKSAYSSKLRYVLSELNRLNAKRGDLERASQHSRVGLRKWQRLIANLTHAYRHEQARLNNDEESISENRQLEGQLRKALQRSDDQLRTDQHTEKQLHEALMKAERFRQNATAQMHAQELHIRTISAAYALEKQERIAAQKEAALRASAAGKAQKHERLQERALQAELQSMGQALNRTRAEWDQREQQLRSQHTKELDALRQEIKAKEAQLNAANSKLHESEHQLASIHTQYVTTEDKVKSLSAEASQAQQLIKKDADLISRCHGHTKKLKKHLEDEFSKQLDGVRRENKNLTAQNTAFKLKLSQQLEHEKALSKNFTGRIVAIEHQKQDLAKRMQAMQQHLSEETALARRTSQEKASLEAKEKSIVGALTSSKEEAEALRADSAKYVAMKKKKHELAQQHREALKKELNSLRTANQTLSAQAQTLVHKLEEDESAKESLASENQALKNKMREHKNLEESIREHEKALQKNFSEQFTALHNANHGLVEALKANVTAKLHSLQHEKAEQEKELLAKNAALDSESAALARQIKDLQKGYVEKYADMESDNDALFSKNEELQNRLESNEAKLANEIETEKAFKQKLDADQQVTEQERAQNKILTDKLRKAEEETEHREKELNDQVQQLKTQLESADAKTSSLAKTREVLTSAVFNALDVGEDGKLDAKDLETFGKLTGFQGTADEWQKEYQGLCHDRGVKPEIGFEQAQFRAMVDDKNETSTHCTDEELAELLGKVSVAAVKPEVLALIHPSKAVVKTEHAPASQRTSELQVSRGDDKMLTAEDLEDLKDAEAET